MELRRNVVLVDLNNISIFPIIPGCASSAIFKKMSPETFLTLINSSPISWDLPMYRQHRIKFSHYHQGCSYKGKRKASFLTRLMGVYMFLDHSINKWNITSMRVQSSASLKNVIES